MRVLPLIVQLSFLLFRAGQPLFVRVVKLIGVGGNGFQLLPFAFVKPGQGDAGRMVVMMMMMAHGFR